ncbi:Dimethylallylcistransferase [Handroanthus impetiginosus]|uniref:Alkyl transferase n=1 Tax=Handroanthus impetiginosus TaxID=429701 RepID=A0A2G9HTC1_9LAMI|nr:Dimethylallylcistransferase [Handroanthus impetiginosus]
MENPGKKILLTSNGDEVVDLHTEKEREGSFDEANFCYLFPNGPLINPPGASKHWTEQSRIRHGPTDSNPNSGLSKLSLVGVSKCTADQIELPEDLKPELMPKHVAVIMDGNRRWAKRRGLPVQLGHRAGGQAMKQLALNCKKFGVQVVTVFAFSTENWVRPKEDVEFLMNLFEEVIQSDIKELIL